MAQAVTLQLPEDSYRRAERLAAAARTDVNALLLNAIERALPPGLEASELDPLAALSDSDLETMASAGFDRRQLRAFDRLLREQGLRDLSHEEQSRLNQLRESYQRAERDKARATFVLALRRQFRAR